jgi:hypothetical protein
MTGRACILLAGLLAVPSGALLTGCQWVLPLHEGDADGRDGSATNQGDAEGSEAAAIDASGSDGAEGVDSASPPCTGKYTYVPACDDCLNQNCCAEATACFITNRAQCFGLFECIASCGFDFFTCPNTCRATYEAGIDDFERINGCANGSCPVACSRDASAE